MSHELRTPLNSLADPVEAPDREPGRQPHGQAARVREDDPRRRLGPPGAHQRHPRSVQDRVRHGRAWKSASVGFRDLADNMERTFRQVAEERELDFLVEIDARSAAERCAPTRSACSRCCATCSRTPSSSPRRAASRLRIGSAEGSPLRAGADWIAFSVTDTGIGIAGGQAAHHLRGLPAGRRHHEPQVWRHRPRPRDQPRDRAASRRRDRRVERSPAAARPSRCSCRSSRLRRARWRRAVGAHAPGGNSGTVLGRAAVGADGAVGLRRRPSCHRHRRSCRADRRGRRDVRLGASRARARAGVQGTDRRRRGDGARARAPLQAARHHPRSSGLPDMDGWALLDLLKHDPRTRHVPIHVISVDDQKQARLARGRLRLPREAGRPRRADGSPVRTKEFIDRPVKTLLLVEDDDGQRMSIAELIERRGGARSPASARPRRRSRRSQARRFDCAIVDLGLPGPARRRADRAHAQDQRRRRTADRRLYRPGPRPGARSGVCSSIASTVIVKEHGFVREAARRDGAVPASDHRRRAGGASRSSSQRKDDASLARPQGPDRRRRRAQHLLADERARAARHGGRLRRGRPRGHRAACERRRTSTSCWSTS